MTVHSIHWICQSTARVDASSLVHLSPQSEEVEITPEMIEAGLAVLYESGAIENPIRSNGR